MKTYKSVEELKGKPQGPDSLRRNGSGKKVCFPGAVKNKFFEEEKWALFEGGRNPRCKCHLARRGFDQKRSETEAGKLGSQCRQHFQI